MIPQITPEDLAERELAERVYPDLSATHHWSLRWDQGFYVDLARAGFISIAQVDRRRGDVLLPEIQSAYAVLDWPAIHASTHVRRIRESGRLETDQVELRVETDCHTVIERIVEQHDPSCWLIPRYRTLIHELTAAGPAIGLEMHGVELWSRRSGELVAGELGYTIGATYTSLSGFCSPAGGEWNHFGSLQLVLLAERLRDSGYAFWNLGHPYMQYKVDLGAKILRRDAFLARWLVQRDEKPANELGTG